MIAIVDYSAGNTQSIKNMLDFIGVDSIISSNKEDLENSDQFILPGVGHFNHSMLYLKENGLIEILSRKVLHENCPILGICLGMQLLTNSSEESSVNGLGWIEGDTKKFVFNSETHWKVPHTGWCNVDFKDKDGILNQISNPSEFYFNHSYYVSCQHEQHVIATSNYGITFPSVIKKAHIWGVQFHPEKSNSSGIQLFRNFIAQQL